MARKNEPTNRYENFDWIAYEQDQRERDEYIEDLFQPLYHDQDIYKTKWLVEGFIPLGALVLVAGRPKVGKACFASALAIAVANGIPFAGMPTAPGAVLWIAAEESPQERTTLMKPSPLATNSTPFFTCYQPLCVDEEDSLEAIGHWVSKTNAKLIVVDPLLGAIRGRSLQDSWSARRSLQALKRFCAARRVTAIVLHHQKKDRIRRGDAVADNSQLAATASMNIILTTAKATDFNVNFLPLDGRGSVNEENSGEGARGEKVDLETKPSIPCIDRVREASCGGGTEGGGEGEEKVDPETKPSLPCIDRVREASCGGGTEGGGDMSSKSRFGSEPRLVRLECEGRGNFANRNILLYSEGPLDYRPTISTKAIKRAESPLSPSEYNVLRALWKADGPVDSDFILVHSMVSLGTARNCITNLRRKSMIHIAQVQNNRRLYAITNEGISALDGYERYDLPLRLAS